MRRTLSSVVAALVAATATSGCAAVYIPGEEAQRSSSTDPAELRRLVRVIPVACDARAASGTVSNPSERPLAVTVAVTWTGADGRGRKAEGQVAVEPGEHADWRVPAPRHARDEAGCSTAVSSVTVGEDAG